MAERPADGATAECRRCELPVTVSGDVWVVFGSDTTADGLSYCPPDPDYRGRSLGVHRPRAGTVTVKVVVDDPAWQEAGERVAGVVQRMRMAEVSGQWAGATEAERVQLLRQAHEEAVKEDGDRVDQTRRVYVEPVQPDELEQEWASWRAGQKDST